MYNDISGTSLRIQTLALFPPVSLMSFEHIFEICMSSLGTTNLQTESQSGGTNLLERFREVCRQEEGQCHINC